MNALKPHISLNVSEIDASVAFYEKAFGTAATKRRPGYAKFDLDSPALNLTISKAPRTGVNVSHFGIQVASSADVAHADPDGNAWEVFVVKGEASVMACEKSAEGRCVPSGAVQADANAKSCRG